MNTRDIVLLAEYLLHRERGTSPFTSYAEAIKVAALLEQSGVSGDESASRALLTRTFGLDPNTVDVTRSACQIHDLLVDYTQALALAVPDDAADSLPGGRARLVNARGGTFLFAEEEDTVQWDEPGDQAPEPDLRKHLANALAVLDVIAPRPWLIRPDRYEPDVTIITDANERCTCGDADQWSPADIENLNLLSVRPNAWDPTQADVDLVLRAIDTTTDHGRPWTIEQVGSWLTVEMEAALGRHGWTEDDLIAVANSLPRAEPSAPSTDVKTDVSASHPASMSHEEVMVALAMSGALCEPCPGPWEAVREDEYRGPGTAHVWGIYAASGAALATLPADIDGPSFVSWVNRHAPADVSLSGSGELRVSERPRPKPDVGVLPPEQHAEATQGFARIAELLLPGQPCTVDRVVERVAYMREAREAVADIILTTSTAIKLAGLQGLSASEVIDRLVAERDSLRRALESVQRERDGLAQAYAVTKENEA